MAYIAKVPVRFGGRQFYIGQEIPAELILSPKRQLDLGTIELVEKPEAPAPEPEKRPEPPKKSGRKAKGGGSAGDA